MTGFRMGSQDGTYALVGGHVLLPDGSRRRRAVVIREDRIVDVCEDADVPENVCTIDCSGKSILPGFIDLHAHPSIHHHYDNSTANRQIVYSVVHAMRLLRAGVTTVRTVGGHGDADIVLDELATQGLILGPRMISGGYILCQTGGHSYDQSIQVDGPEDIRRIVRKEILAGHKWIKLMVSGGFVSAEESPTTIQFSRKEVKMAAREAHRAGVKVAAHAHGADAILMAVECGADSIEHGSFIDDRGIAAMIEHDAFLVPTFSTYAYAATLDHHPKQKANREMLIPKTELFRAAVDAGVKWGLGTDNQGGSSLELMFDEIIILVDQVGLDAKTVIRQATRGNAELLGLDDVGDIAPGFVADLVIIDGDPLERIADIARVVGTVDQGRHVDWESLAPLYNLWTLDTLDGHDVPDGRLTPSRVWAYGELP